MEETEDHEQEGIREELLTAQMQASELTGTRISLLAPAVPMSIS